MSAAGDLLDFRPESPYFNDTYTSGKNYKAISNSRGISVPGQPGLRVKTTIEEVVRYSPRSVDGIIEELKRGEERILKLFSADLDEGVHLVKKDLETVVKKSKIDPDFVKDALPENMRRRLREFLEKEQKKIEEKILELGPEKVAAFIGEPIQGAGGVIIPPDTYWPEVQRICDEYGIPGDTCWPEPEYAETVNGDELGQLALTDDMEDAIVAFMEALSDGFAP